MARKTLQTIQDCMEFNRERTLGLLDEIAKLPDPQAVLGWRAGEGRAHIAWHLMHIAVTEELFATARITGTQPAFGDLVARYQGGSTPDDDIPSLEEIRDILTHSRQHFTEAFAKFQDEELDIVPEPLRERGWDLRKVLHVLNWHEAHHHGQSHATLNLYKAQALQRS